MTAKIIFTKAYKNAIAPMPGDKSALGNLPVSAFQYCEAARVASSLGWYIFPPMTMSLMFDGRELFLADEGQWRPFSHESFDAEFQEDWNRVAPDWLQSRAPSYLLPFSEPGMLQIWSGYFVETAPGFDLHIRPIANAFDVSAYYCFEAIVETDVFSPMPLFINIKIVRTDCEIFIQRERPLFQVCAIAKSAKHSQSASFRSIYRHGVAADKESEEFNWEGLRNTLRIAGVTVPRKAVGTYGAEVRKRDKSTP